MTKYTDLFVGKKMEDVLEKMENRDVLDEILNLIESVSESFSYLLFYDQIH